MLANPSILFYTVFPSEHTHPTLAEVPPYILQAIPWFAILVLIEVAISAFEGCLHRRYSLKETICSFALGIMSQITGIPFGAFGLFLYVSAFEKYRVMTVPYDSAACWVALVVGVDFFYYWLHRFCHEFHLGWLGHSVHHSGEFYNFATALRQGAFQAIPSSFVYLPLALLGLPPSMFVTHKAFNLLYQFWIHTEVIGSLGPLEYVLNTPSHHRVHHRPGANCNYAGVFIVWDRMFATFKAEDANQDKYGLGKPLGTFDPLVANVEHAIRVVPSLGWGFYFRRRLPPRWRLEVRALWKPMPGGRAALWKRPLEPARPKYVGSAPPAASARRWIESAYLLASSIACLVVFALLEVCLKKGAGGRYWHWLGGLCLHALWLLLSLSSLGRLADGRPDARQLEWARLVLAFPLRSVLLGAVPERTGTIACAAHLGIWALVSRGWWVQPPQVVDAKIK